MNHLLRLLVFLKVVDSHDGQVSLTSLLVWAVLLRMLLGQDFSGLDLGALLAAVAQYTGKKVLSERRQNQDALDAAAQAKAEAQAESRVAATLSEVDQLKARVQKLTNMAGLQ